MSPPGSRNGELIERRTAVCPLDAESSSFAHAGQAVPAERTVTDKKTGEVTEGVRIYIRSMARGEATPRRMAFQIQCA